MEGGASVNADPALSGQFFKQSFLAATTCYGLHMSSFKPQPRTASGIASGIIALVLLAGLSACASEKAGYPSLARRPAERLTEAPQTKEPAPPPPLSQPMLDRLDRLVAQARSADARFRSREAATRQSVNAASGAAVASESWSVATVALSGLETARSQAVIALADLDSLYAEQGVAGSDVGPIANARAQVMAMIAEEDAVLAALSSQLKR